MGRAERGAPAWLPTWRAGPRARAHRSSHIFARPWLAHPWESASPLGVPLGGAGRRSQDARSPGGPSLGVAPRGFSGAPQLTAPACRLGEQCSRRGAGRQVPGSRASRLALVLRPRTPPEAGSLPPTAGLGNASRTGSAANKEQRSAALDDWILPPIGHTPRLPCAVVSGLCWARGPDAFPAGTRAGHRGRRRSGCGRSRLTVAQPEEVRVARGGGGRLLPVARCGSRGGIVYGPGARRTSCAAHTILADVRAACWPRCSLQSRAARAPSSPRFRTPGSGCHPV